MLLEIDILKAVAGPAAWSHGYQIKIYVKKFFFQKHKVIPKILRWIHQTEACRSQYFVPIWLEFTIPNRRYSSVRPSIHQATPIYSLESILAHKIYEREWTTLIQLKRWVLSNFVKLKLKDLKLFNKSFLFFNWCHNLCITRYTCDIKS